MEKVWLKSGFLLVTALSIICTVGCENQAKTNNILESGMEIFQSPSADWKMVNNELVLPVKNSKENRTNLWLKDTYGDFVMELDFKINKGTNSGIFFRTSDTTDPVQTGIEVQVRDDFGKLPMDKHFCGSVYEIYQATENRVKAPGQWNSLKITCKGNNIEVILNSGKVVDINLEDWKEVGKNPDGSENKFKKAYKDMAKKGFIGFQDHGGEVWYRNITIQNL